MRTIDPAILFAAMASTTTATTLPSPKTEPVKRTRRITFAPVQPVASTAAN